MYQNYISDHTYLNASTQIAFRTRSVLAKTVAVMNEHVKASFSSDLISFTTKTGTGGHCSLISLDHLHSMITPFVCTAVGNVSVPAASSKGLSAFMFRYESAQPLAKGSEISFDSTDLCLFPLVLSAISSDSKVVSFSFSGKATVYAEPFISSKPNVYFGFGFTCADMTEGEGVITSSLNQVVHEVTPFQPLK